MSEVSRKRPDEVMLARVVNAARGAASDALADMPSEGGWKRSDRTLGFYAQLVGALCSMLAHEVVPHKVRTAGKLTDAFLEAIQAQRRRLL